VRAAVTDVDVERDGEGAVRVNWTLEGESPTVDLAWGRSPDGVDHEHLQTAEAAAGSAELAGLPPGRVYVSVAASGQGGALIGATRNLGLPGPTNFRDMGGYLGAEGRRVRWGRVFRSDALVFEDRAFAGFLALGIRAIYDLRSDTERETNPNHLPEGDHRVHHYSLVGEESARPAIEAGLTDGEAFLSELYTRMLETMAPSFGAILTGLADQAQLPAVFHCAAGKDRTGMVAALLLLGLGVDETVVLDDYELTSRYRTAEQVQAVMVRLEGERNIAAEVVAGILRTPRWAMEAAVKEIEHRHGGIDGYLTTTAGVGPETLDRLRAALLT
jgi:protein-tyrosine phosphatase